jgi:hypothetical protein
MEVPWIVNLEAMQVTLPVEADPYTLESYPSRSLVGSAEQSFISLMQQGQLNRGGYVAASPCFRSDSLDHLHQEYFFKVELISINPEDPEKTLDECIRCARFFFQSHTDHCVSLDKTHEGFDLSIRGVEVGSYGIRSHKEFTWVYGTGLAEPRFSVAK